ncbi:DUF1552 domain-containing protein [Prosthecobacter sp.]|uniref:DUF1552 domain-containing protein n=1 Tax=Prosthecobacter sp. TaxID=1965333 RepID=UPI002ABA2217|nr:DUF1552 domain-containing protein [Prosthecobacter sp.]MDZ4401405.1 DUF1552 domain-containing protein [Prosthecobacter sp.]
MKPISRREMLRGTGAALALPLLEAMQAPRAFAAAAKPPCRMVFVYASTGVAVPYWTPKGEGADYEMSPTLSTLKAFKDDMLVISGLDHRREDRASNEHDMASSTLLSTAPIGQRDRATYATGISVDQVAAKKLGDLTRLPSLELGCDANSSRMHVSNVSWRGPAMPMGREFRPRQVFARLFGDPSGDAYRRSTLDYVLGSARRLQSRLGAQDRDKLGEYLESIHSIEQRIAAAERHAVAVAPKMALPEGVPGDFSEHLRLMCDLLVVALQSDVTRVSTFMFANESDDHAFPQLGIPEGHHALSHYNPLTDEGKAQEAKLQKVDQFYIEHFEYLLSKMKATRDGEGTLLDNCMVCYASGLSYPNKHSRIDIPVVLAGRAGGTLAPGRHVRHPAGTPFSNLLLSMLDRMDVPLDRVSDSTGRLPGLT